MRILLVEDEIGLSDALCQALKRENYTPIARYDGESGLDEALTGAYDAIILDVMLPRMDGFAVLRRLRAESFHTPVLLLTAKSELDSRVTGLDAGADYYLTKPFEMRELMACLRAITRRPDTLVENEPAFGDLTLRRQQGGVFCNASGQFVKMGPKELHLLGLLMNNPGNIIPKETLLTRVWGLDSDSEYNNVEVYVSFVRKKLNFIGSKVTIQSTRGMGYRLEVCND